MMSRFLHPVASTSALFYLKLFVTQSGSPRTGKSYRSLDPPKKTASAQYQLLLNSLNQLKNLFNGIDAVFY